MYIKDSGICCVTHKCTVFFVCGGFRGHIHVNATFAGRKYNIFYEFQILFDGLGIVTRRTFLNPQAKSDSLRLTH